MRPQLERGLCWLVGNGVNILIWRDPWIPFIPGFKPSYNSEALAAMEVDKVADLIDQESGQWNRSLLWRLFSPEHVEAILKIHLGSDSCADQQIWTLEKSGRFTIKSMYREVVRQKSAPLSPIGVKWWAKLWKL